MQHRVGQFWRKVGTKMSERHGAERKPDSKEGNGHKEVDQQNELTLTSKTLNCSSDKLTRSEMGHNEVTRVSPFPSEPLQTTVTFGKENMADQQNARRQREQVSKSLKSKMMKAFHAHDPSSSLQDSAKHIRKKLAQRSVAAKVLRIVTQPAPVTSVWNVRPAGAEERSRHVAPVHQETVEEHIQPDVSTLNSDNKGFGFTEGSKLLISDVNKVKTIDDNFSQEPESGSDLAGSESEAEEKKENKESHLTGFARRLLSVRKGRSDPAWLQNYGEAMNYPKREIKNHIERNHDDVSLLSSTSKAETSRIQAHTSDDASNNDLPVIKQEVTISEDAEPQTTENGSHFYEALQTLPSRVQTIDDDASHDLEDREQEKSAVPEPAQDHIAGNKMIDAHTYEDSFSQDLADRDKEEFGVTEAAEPLPSHAQSLEDRANHDIAGEEEETSAVSEPRELHIMENKMSNISEAMLSCQSMPESCVEQDIMDSASQHQGEDNLSLLQQVKKNGNEIEMLLSSFSMPQPSASDDEEESQQSNYETVWTETLREAANLLGYRGEATKTKKAKAAGGWW